MKQEPLPLVRRKDRHALYRIVQARRDIRHFRRKPVPGKILQRVLEAAHRAPSVGYMQPWNFILVSSKSIRSKIKKSFEKTNARELARLQAGERKDLYSKLKLEGILEAPLNVAVTCDHRRDAPFVLGRAPHPQTDLFSVCLAIQNMWLAARAEGVGVGWVSILDHRQVESVLRLPRGVELVAYLCVGYPLEFRRRPMLEELGWKSRAPLKDLIFTNRWNSRPR